MIITINEKCMRMFEKSIKDFFENLFFTIIKKGMAVKIKNEITE